ncbi:MAG: hypothetical protein H0V81_16725 [Solirubrobacterales bacterium]|nr:hypothetical protein [Solirubrobacterales bacterium]
MKFRPLALLALLLLTLASGGCGDDTEAANAYVEQVQSAQRGFADSFRDVRQRLAPTSTLKQDRETLGEFSGAAQRFADQLGAITPPEAVRDEHGRLVAVVGEYKASIEAAEERLDGATPEERAAVRSELSSSVQDTQDSIGAAIGAINNALRG